MPLPIGLRLIPLPGIGQVLHIEVGQYIPVLRGFRAIVSYPLSKPIASQSLSQVILSCKSQGLERRQETVELGQAMGVLGRTFSHFLGQSDHETEAVLKTVLMGERHGAPLIEILVTKKEPRQRLCKTGRDTIPGERLEQDLSGIDQGLVATQIRKTGVAEVGEAFCDPVGAGRTQSTLVKSKGPSRGREVQGSRQAPCEVNRRLSQAALQQRDVALGLTQPPRELSLSQAGRPTKCSEPSGFQVVGNMTYTVIFVKKARRGKSRCPGPGRRRAQQPVERCFATAITIDPFGASAERNSVGCARL